jgi:hypothetical protein
MEYSNQRVIPFRGNFLDVLKQVAKDGLLVDVILNHVPRTEEYHEIIFKETLSIRIIHVGEDYLILGPKRPLSNCIIPIDEILLVRLSEEYRRDDEDIIDERIERGHPDWEPKWVRGEEIRALSPDGLMHRVEEAGLENLPHDSILAVFINDGSNSAKKVSKILTKLAKEYDSDILFIQTNVSRKLINQFKISKTPAVIVSLGNKVHRIIEGVASAGDYRVAIGNVLSQYSTRKYY